MRNSVVTSLLILSLVSCGETREAGVVVVIPTDLAVPQDLDDVQIQVVHATRGEVLRDHIRLSGTERLPLTYGIGPSRGELPGPYTFRVIGMLKGRAKTLSEAVTDVPRENVRALTMPVEFLCYDKVKTLDNGQVIGLCPTGETCVAGECKPIAVFQAEQLPIYQRPEPLPSGGAAPPCYDALACFATPVWLSPDRATCRVSKPASMQGFTAGLVSSQVGVPYHDKKLVVFDTDGVAAWRDLGTQIQLPIGICRAMDQLPDAVLVASTTCANKQGNIPLCKVTAPSPDASAGPPADADAVAPVDALVQTDAVVLADAVADVLADAAVPVDSDEIADADADADAGRVASSDVGDAFAPGPDALLDVDVFANVRVEVASPEPAPDADAYAATDVAPDGLEKDIAVEDAPLDVPVVGECEVTGGGYKDAGEPCLGGLCDGTGRCRQCNPGERQCSGTTPQTCTDEGRWLSEANCPYVCKAGICSGACVPGTTKCGGPDPRYLWTCLKDGQFVVTEVCSLGCERDDCNCTPGTKACGLFREPRACNAEGRWVVGSPCPYQCSQGACTGP